jgi:hypothetical protein
LYCNSWKKKFIKFIKLIENKIFSPPKVQLLVGVFWDLGSGDYGYGTGERESRAEPTKQSKQLLA